MNRLTWNDVEEACDRLALKIKESGFKPDYIIGVTTGGLFPLALLSIRLEMKNILSVTAQKMKNGEEETVKIKHLPDVDLKGKSILLVDEVAQSGLTLKIIGDAVKDALGAEVLKTAALAANHDVCEIFPDYYVLKEEGDWIFFPWEKEEEFYPYDLAKNK